MSSQASGAQRRARGACESGSGFCFSRVSSRQGRLRRKYGTPTARRPYHLFSMGAAAPIARSAPPSFQMVGMARRRRPKIQVRSAVREEHASRKPVFAFRGRVPDKGGFAANMGPRRRGVPTIYFRWALPRRLRVRRPLRSKW